MTEEQFKALKVGDRVRVVDSPKSLNPYWQRYVGYEFVLTGYTPMPEPPGHSGFWNSTLTEEQRVTFGMAPASMVTRLGFRPWDIELVAPPATQAKSYPHTCPRCGSSAYVGFAQVDCSRGCR